MHQEMFSYPFFVKCPYCLYDGLWLSFEASLKIFKSTNVTRISLNFLDDMYMIVHVRVCVHVVTILIVIRSCFYSLDVMHIPKPEEVTSWKEVSQTHTHPHLLYPLPSYRSMQSYTRIEKQGKNMK